MNRRRRQGKKRPSSQSWNRDDSDDEETVNDLAYAATFAMVPPLSSPNPQTFENGGDDDDNGMSLDGNEIDIATDDKNENGDEDSTNDVDADNDSEAGESSESSSDDSDEDGEEKEKETSGSNNEEEPNEGSNRKEDLVDAMERMTEDDDNNGASIEPPKTENEIDPYRTPIEKLEEEMNLRLSVEDEVASTSTDKLHLELAGKVRNHLVENRTVVVESVQSGKLLDEGSLLVLRITESSGQHTLVPLGRILEVFGPVSQPLYTIRLRQPKTVSHTKKTVEKPKFKSDQAATMDDDKPPSEQNDEKKTEDSAIPTSNTSQSEANEECAPSALSTEVVPDVPNDSAASGIDAANASPTKAEVAKSSHVDSSNELSELQDDNNTKEQSIDKESTQVQEATDQGSEHAQDVPVDDPWSPNGKYTQLLSRKGDTSNLSVYFIEDESKFLDTVAIMKSSRKGCDASNLYDEEVINVNEMYFSDDEEERQAKNRRKPRGGESGNRSQRSKQHSDTRGRGRGRGRARNRHQHASQSAFAPQNWVPQGFHQSAPHVPGQAQGFYPQPPMMGTYPGTYPQAVVQHAYPSSQPSFGMHAPSQGIPPPPPPPPQPQYGQQAPPTGFAQAYQHPPPPPPPQGSGGYGRNVPGGPPAHNQQQSHTNPNTFYYDYS